MDVTRNKQGRIVLFFFAAIVIPCLALGILAFRGIKNDRALVERQNRVALEGFAAESSSVIERRVKSFTDNFTEECGDPDTISGKTFSDACVRQWKRKLEPGVGVIYVDADGRRILERNGLLFTKGLIQAQGTLNLSDGMPSTGWILEFQKQDYAGAREFYESQLGKDTTRHCMIYGALARIAMKMQDQDLRIRYLQESIPSCQRIIDSRLPTGLNARLELAKYYASQNDSIKAEHMAASLLREIMSGEYLLEESSYYFYLNQVSPFLNAAHDSSAGLIDSLRRLEVETKAELEFLEMANLNLSEERGLVQLAGTETGIQVVSLRNGAFWVFLWPREVLTRSVITPVIDSLAEANQIRMVLAEESSDSMTPAVPGGNPKSKILSAVSLGSFEWPVQMWMAERTPLFGLYGDSALYLLLFVGITGVLVIGLVFTLRLVNSEMRLSQMQSDFISNVSHELRSPVTSIRHLAENLMEGKVPSESKRQNYYRVMLEQSNRLSHLIENVLDTTSLDNSAEAMAMEEGHLPTFLDQQLDIFQSRIENGGFNLHRDIDATIPMTFFDKNTMGQLVHNLLDNAYKYSGDSRDIFVRLSQREETLHLEVKDLGIGIDPQETDRIFERFYRGTKSGAQAGGSGIGLALVQQIAKLHGGSVDVSSAKGEGTTMKVVFPVNIKPS